MIEINATMRCCVCRSTKPLVVRLNCVPINPTGWVNLTNTAVELPEGWRVLGDPHRLYCPSCPPRGPYR